MCKRLLHFPWRILTRTLMMMTSLHVYVAHACCCVLEDDVHMVRTEGNNDEPVEIFSRRGIFEFEVQACSQAHVRLVKTPLIEYYTVMIGKGLA